MTTTFVTGMLTGLIAELAAVGPGRSHWTIWAATLACMVIGAALGAAVFIAWRPGAPLVAMLLVATVTGAATWLTRPGGRGLTNRARDRREEKARAVAVTFACATSS